MTVPSTLTSDDFVEGPVSVEFEPQKPSVTIDGGQERVVTVSQQKCYSAPNVGMDWEVMYTAKGRAFSSDVGNWPSYWIEALGGDVEVSTHWPRHGTKNNRSKDRIRCSEFKLKTRC